MKFSTVATVLVASTSQVQAIPFADPTLSLSWGFNSISSLWNWWNPLPAWPPACPTIVKVPLGYPYCKTTWDFSKYKFPGACKDRWTPVYNPGCKPSTPERNFTLQCPTSDRQAGSIFDGQIQCGSPYPAQDVANKKGLAAVVTSFSLKDGALFDNYSRACEISAGNQLQCNAISDLTKAQKGFAINTAGQLEFNGENTWYGCNIGTSNAFGDIIFTGTHKDFTGVQSATENANCDAYRLTVSYN